ncbi:MAG: type I restriction-modification system subunit M [Epulopiscium sp.]|nr:type I restriction-modification system subunit M [Candidatus Epulonipiscium sp.]
MTKTEIQRKQLDKLHSTIWDIACSFWGKMEPDDYKDYVLGLLFYRFLSEKVEKTVEQFLAYDEIKEYEKAWEIPEYREGLEADLITTLGYVIEPQYLFSSMVDMITVKKEGFEVEFLQKGINSLMESTMGQESQESFEGIFDDMDLTSTKLGKSIKDRNKLLAKAIVSINEIDFEHEEAHIDVLGDAYEYLIGQFAATAGKKSGAFYTPAQAGILLAKLTTVGRTKASNVFDACGGSGSLLLHVGDEVDVANYYYQELTANTFNVARMSFLLHDVEYQKMHMVNDDSLEYPAFLDVPMDVIVANPPYSQRWEASEKFLEDERFSEWGVIPPKSYADYAFTLSMLHTLKEDGTMAILLPHGVLFRGGREGEIRRKLIEKNYIDAIIGLPANAFYGTSIPVAVLVFKKNKEKRDILFIDASKDFVKEGNKNYITDESIDKIVNTFIKREDIDKYSYLADFNEIEENDFNLNIPRYVDTFEEEEPVDIDEKRIKYVELEKKSKELDDKIESFFKELGL